MHPEEKKEEIQGFYSSLLLSFVTAAIIIYAAVLKFSLPPPPAATQVTEEKATVSEKFLHNRTIVETDVKVTPRSPEMPEEKIEKKSKPSSPLARGTELFKSGDFDSAANAWERVITSPEYRNSYTIQLLLACKKETITKAFKHNSKSAGLFYVKNKYKEMACYRLCMGLYKSRDEAEAGRSNVPEYFSGMGNRPVIVPVSKLMEGVTVK